MHNLKGVGLIFCQWQPLDNGRGFQIIFVWIAAEIDFHGIFVVKNLGDSGEQISIVHG